MSKNFFDPEFGEMIPIAEVEALTGISKATIRNWRKPEHQHLAKFDYYSNGGRDVFYRRADVDAYLAESGVQVGQSGFKRIEMPNSIKAPLVIPEFVGAKRDEAIALAGFTTENAYWQIETWIAKQGQGFLSRVWQPTWAKVNEALEEPVTYVTFNARWEDFTWFTQAVHVIRTYVAESQGLDISIAEIVKLPVGAVPPTKEKNY